jgi:phage-related tail protein
MMDWDMVWKALSVSLPCWLAIYTFVATRRKVVNTTIEAIGERLDTHGNRIARLETTVQSMPGKDDMHSLQLELVKQTGSLNEMRAVMEGNAKIMARLEAIVTRHENHLLDGGKTK